MRNVRAEALGAVHGQANPSPGPLVELRLVAVDEATTVPAGEGGMPEPIRWNVLAYEVELKSRRMALTREGFEEAVRNFARYGQVPVVLYHADTDPAAHPDAAKAHGWLTELRVGSMVRNSTAERVATLEGRIRWVNPETRAAVETGELAFGSITILLDAIDEETGEEIGQYLYSFSLTNKPALKDMPRIQAAAGAHPANVPAVPPRVDQLTRPTVRESLAVMDHILALATFLGFAVQDAAAANVALRTFAAEVSKMLGLGEQPRHDAIVAKLTGLVNEAAKLPETQKRLTQAINELNGMRKAEATQTVAALQASGAIAKNDKARDAAIALFMQDRGQFVEIFGEVPLQGTRADDAALLTRRVTPEGDGEHVDFSNGAGNDFSDMTADVAAELQAKHPQKYPQTYEGMRNALFEASKIVRARYENDGDRRH